MRQKFIQYPFGTAGDLTTIPDATQPSGSVSFQSGWPFDYERQLGVDPLALPIDRQTMNYLFKSITENLQQYQEYGVPEFITSANNGGSAFAYDFGAMVRYSATGNPPFTTYISVLPGAGTNTSVPGADSNWALTAIAVPKIQAMIQQWCNYAIDTGIANAYVIALSPAITSYSNGQRIVFKAVHSNTGASTIDAGAGAMPLKNNSGGALLAGDIAANSLVDAIYDNATSAFLITRNVPSQLTVGAKVISNALVTGGIWGGDIVKASAHVLSISPASCLDSTRMVQLYLNTTFALTIPTAANGTYHCFFVKLVADGSFEFRWYTTEAGVLADSQVSAFRWIDFWQTNGSSNCKDGNTTDGVKIWDRFADNVINSGTAAPAGITTAIDISGIVPVSRISSIKPGAQLTSGTGPLDIAVSGVSGTAQSNFKLASGLSGAGDIFEWGHYYADPGFLNLVSNNLYWGKGTGSATGSVQLALHELKLRR